MQRICSSLVAAGHDVKLIGVNRKDSAELSEQTFKQKRVSVLFQQGKLFYLEYNVRLFFILLFTRSDVYYGVDLDTILPNYFVSKLKNKKCVYDAHEIFPEVPEVVNRRGVKKMWERVEGFSVRRIKNLLTVSDGLKDYFKVKYGKEFMVVRNLPLRNKKVPATSSTEKIIFYQGALNVGRGLNEMILAMHQLDATLVLCGEGDLSAALRALVAKENLADKIIFKGKLKPDDLRRETENCYLGINLLENRGQSYYLSLANKFFDYIQSGKPSLNMNFPEYKKLNDEYHVGLLLDDLKTETIVNSCNKLLNDYDLYAQLKSNCLLAADDLFWEKEEKIIISFFKNIR